jgi:hypothetical protein
VARFKMMAARQRKVTLVLVALCVAWLAYLLLLRGAPSGASPLLVDSESLDFGRAWDQPGFEWRVPIQNTSGRAVEVVSVEPSCRCVEANPRTFVVPADDQVAIALRLSLRDSKGESRECWPFSAKIVAKTKEAPPAQATWSVHGQVYQHPVRPAVEALHLDGFVVGSQFRKEAVPISSNRPVQKLTARCDPAFASVEVLPTAEAGSFELEIRPNNSLPVGKHKAIVDLESTVDLSGLPPGLGPPPALPLPVTVEVCHSVYASPSTMALGVVPVGETERDVVALRSLGDISFRVIEAQVVDGDASLSVEPAPTSDARVLYYSIIQKSTTRGPRAAEVQFTVREEESGSTYPVVVAVTYHGVEI